MWSIYYRFQFQFREMFFVFHPQSIPLPTPPRGRLALGRPPIIVYYIGRPPRSPARQGHTSAAIGGTLYVFGVLASSTSVEAYDPNL